MKLFLFLILVAVSNVNAHELKVLTYNIRQDLDFWDERLAPLTKEIMQVDPDIIFLQEVKVSRNQLSQIIDEMNKIDPSKNHEYYVYQDIKPGLFKYSGEGLAILSKFPIIKTKYITLSNILGRMGLMAQIQINDDLKVNLYNIHLDFMWNKFRDAQIKTLFKALKEESDVPIILGGDFNSTENSFVINSVLKNNFIDTFKTIYGDQTDIVGNTNSVDTKKIGIPLEDSLKRRIDYLFTKDDHSKNKFSLIDSFTIGFEEISKGLHPSDHLGLFLKLDIN